MKNNLVSKFLNFVGVEEVDEYEQEAEEPQWEPEPPRRKRSSIVNFPNSARGGVRVVVMHPRTLEDGQSIADQIKSRRPVIVNLDQADERSGQRLLNFLSGVVYALDGSLRKVGEGIFLATPSNVEVAGEDYDDGEWVRSFTK
jgi:cell division inhibitor SepF